MTSPHASRDDLSALLDDELSDEEFAALQRELEGDDELRAELEELRGVAEGLRSMGALRAPEGFLAGVMARVDAGEGANEPLFADTGADVVPLIAVASIEEATVPGGVELSDKVVGFPWWVKGPVIAAVAALLVVGVGISIRDPGPAGPPAASEVVAFAPSEPSAPPRPTGSLEGDGLGEVEFAAEETPEAAERIRMMPTDSERVAVGGAGTSPARLSPPRRSGLREIEAPAEPPPGVVAVVEAEYAPEAADALALADEDAVDGAGLMPSSPSQALSASEPLSSRSADQSAMPAVASLRTSNGDAVAALRDAAVRRGWQLSYVSPGDAAVKLSDIQPEAVVELTLPPGDEIAAQNVLDGLGSFSFTSTPERARSERSQLRVTIIYSP